MAEFPAYLNLMELELAELTAMAAPFGFVPSMVTDLAPLAEGANRLAIWTERGFAGEMAFMQQEGQRRAEVRRFLPEARSAITLLLRYSAASPGPTPRRSGRVARYAWGRDYHAAIPTRLTGFIRAVERRVGREIKHRVFSDAVPLLERSLAVRSGLGFIGRNTMLVAPRVGSYTFISELLWDLAVESSPRNLTAGGCGGCRRCVDRCPTNALTEDGFLDARRCISYLTVEKRGCFTADERVALGEWIFGCDVCQECCPFNHRTQTADDDVDNEFSREQGVGPFLDLIELYSIRSEREYTRRFQDTPLLRTRRAGLLRNAASVIANRGLVEALPVLLTAAQSDYSPIVRIEALAAAFRLASLSGEREVARVRRCAEALDSTGAARTKELKLM